MTRALNYLLLAVYLLYFGSFLTGSWQMEIDADEAARQDAAIEEYIQAEIPALEEKSAPGLAEPVPQNPAPWHWAWQPGYPGMALLLSRLAQDFHDPILESESRPQLLFDEIDRSLAANLTLAILMTVWIVFLVLTLYSLLRRHWFYERMSLFAFGISMLITITNLLTTRKLQIHDFSAYSNLPLLGALLETGLLLLSALVLLQRTLPQSSSKQTPSAEQGFMLHTSHKPAENAGQSLGFLTSGGHVIIILLTGLLIANLLLLPLYQLQLNFPAVFIFSLVFLCATLMLWYIQAYVRIMHAKHNSWHWLAGISYLGFRITRNTLFISSVIVLISLILTVILIMTFYNTAVLQWLQILPPASSL
ncbi:MAG: hypothetical protein KDK39_08270 [Leptospiraceae bacterium]|nr:hypothetical protein [Leptospiraceae bacterium]